MDYSKLQLFQMMQTKMAYHSERQDVLARNIANADTPGFEPDDLAPLNFERQLRNMTRKRLQMTTTAPEHQSGQQLRSPDYRSEAMESPFERKPVRNMVNVEQQMMLMNDNALSFQTTTTLYNKTASLMRTAINNK